jgi:hypothetical protein
MSSLDRLHVCPTLLVELGRRHVKKFYTNICFIQHRGESSDRITMTGRLPVAIEGYGPLVQRHIVVVIVVSQSQMM